MRNIMTTANQTTAPTQAAALADKTADDRFTRAKQARDIAIKRDAERQSAGAVRERAPDLGGPQLKLTVHGTIPGYHMYWENDEDGKIEQLLFDGFDFVTPDEVRRGSDLVADMDLTNRISRYVGRHQDGSPLRAYLMKCPDEIWEARQAGAQRQVNDWDEQIRNGRMKAQEGQYVPKGTTSKLETNAKV
jgi:hypothetical protein